MATPDLAIRPLLVNRYEKLADRLLADSAQGDRLLTKVGLADVIDVEALDSSLKTYALKAHLDFVMVDVESSLPSFAVELDGRQHWRDPNNRRRDAMKDRLCERANLPLLRITSEFTRKRAAGSC